MKRFFPLILVIVLVFFSFCTKDQSETPPGKVTYRKEVHYDAALYSYRFKAGSVWIYKNIPSAVLDTVTILSAGDFNWDQYPCGVHGYVPDTCESYYNYAMEFHSSQSGLTHFESLAGHYYDYGKAAYMMSAYALFSVPQSSGNNLVFADDSVVLGTQTYYHCFKVKLWNANPAYSYPFPDTTYMTFCPNYGMVRKEIPSQSQDWQLISSALIQ